MRVVVCADDRALGSAVATEAARRLREAVEARGQARLLLSTGRSQFTTLEALVREQVPWGAVDAFHLDEYVGLAPDHPASFRRYLRERLAARVPLRALHGVDPAGDLAALAAEVRAAPIDVGLVGIGENGHVAFNDPPADFDTEEAYLTVTLDAACRRQQVGEGWFASLEEVPLRAVTMSVRQILACRVLLSAVPYAVKAEAVRRVLAGGITPEVPASALRRHPDATLYLDRDSGALLDTPLLARYGGGRAGEPRP